MLEPGDRILRPDDYGAAGIEACISPVRIVGKPVGPEHWGCQFLDFHRVPPLRRFLLTSHAGRAAEPRPA